MQRPSEKLVGNIPAQDSDSDSDLDPENETDLQKIQSLVNGNGNEEEDDPKEKSNPFYYKNLFEDIQNRLAVRHRQFSNWTIPQKG
jgi:hypothetical protein